MTAFAQGFQNYHNISDAMERDRSAGCHLPSHSTKSHNFFDAQGEIY